MKCLIVYIYFVLALATTCKSIYINESEIRDPYDTVNIVSGYKYPIKEYVVNTADGYILKIHRMQCPDKHTRNKKSVLIMCDFWSSSVFWVLSGPKYSLAFYLANLGYDVWLGNNRGSKYGQDGIVVKPKDPAFWFYSVHEFGLYDLPAIIDFILDVVKCHQLSYIGWGYGATQFFVMASLRPEYVKKIKNMQALGPSVYLSHVRSPLVHALVTLDEQLLNSVLGRDVVSSGDGFLKLGGQKCCMKMVKDKNLCKNLESLAVEAFDLGIPGFPEVLDYPRVQASTRFMFHAKQQILNGFRYYDNGESSNLYFYGCKIAPKYNIQAADLPIAVYYAEGDVICSAEDVMNLANKLPNLIKVIKVDDDHFGHNSFPLSKSGCNSFYKSVYHVLENF